MQLTKCKLSKSKTYHFANSLPPKLAILLQSVRADKIVHGHNNSKHNKKNPRNLLRFRGITVIGSNVIQRFR